MHKLDFGMSPLYCPPLDVSAQLTFILVTEYTIPALCLINLFMLPQHDFIIFIMKHQHIHTIGGVTKAHRLCLILITSDTNFAYNTLVWKTLRTPPNYYTMSYWQSFSKDHPIYCEREKYIYAREKSESLLLKLNQNGQLLCIKYEEAL